MIVTQISKENGLRKERLIELLIGKKPGMPGWSDLALSCRSMSDCYHPSGPENRKSGAGTRVWPLTSNGHH